MINRFNNYKLRKIIYLVLALILCISAFASCNSNNDNDIDSTNEVIKDSNKLSDGENKDQYESKQYWVMMVTKLNANDIAVAEVGANGNAIETRMYKVPNWFEGTTVDIKVGDKITIVHNGEVTETDPIEFAVIYEMQYKNSNGSIISVIPQD